MIKYNKSFNLDLFTGVYSASSFHFVFFSGNMPTKTFMQNLGKARPAGSASLANILEDAGLRSDGTMLGSMTFPEQAPSIMDRVSFPEFKINLNAVPNREYRFHNEGTADWFIFCIHRYHKANTPMEISAPDREPFIMAVGKVGDLGSGKDVEMNERQITADLSIRASNMRVNFDRTFRMEV